MDYGLQRIIKEWIITHNKMWDEDDNGESPDFTRGFELGVAITIRELMK